MSEEDAWSQKLTAAEAFHVMQLYLASHRDVINSSDDIGWFVTHVTAEDDPAHKREWLEAMTKIRSDDAD